MPENNLELLRFTLGAWQTNCYVLAAHPDPGSPCWIIDTGFDPDEMLDAIDTKGWIPSRILLTHAHVDHIAGLGRTRERFPDIPVAIHADERNFLDRPDLNLSAMLPTPITWPPAEDTLHHDDNLTLADGLDFQVRHVPGHSPGGVCFYQPDSALAIVGDALFAGSIGRHDFPTSDGPLLLKSIAEQLLTLPDETVIFPGHGPESTIAREKQTNPYVGSNPSA
ncbi:MAG: MBL fold metallo-hydrolase [Phycisphaeraceae bacterium]